LARLSTGRRRYHRGVRRAEITAAVALAAAAACTAADEAPEAGIDARVIVAPPPIDAPPVVIDALIRDARPGDARPFDFDAFPCVVRPLNQDVATLAGCGVPGAVDGARAMVRLDNPVNVVLGPDGDVYVADHGNHRVRAIRPDGTTRTVIDQEGFRRPWGMAFAADGSFYVQTDEDDEGRFDEESGTLWRVDRSGRTAAVVLSNVGRPRGMAALADGRIALADPAHHVVRLFVKTQVMDLPPTYAVEALAGGEDRPGFVNATGAAARFNRPAGITALPDGDLLVADENNHRVRRVTLGGVVTTFAGRGGIGDDDGAAADARFNAPQDVAADMEGNVFVSDVDNHVVRMIAAGQVSTLAGDRTAGYEDSDDLRAARFFGMQGIEVAPDGKTVWLADGTRGDDLPYHRVRRIRLP
jgi:DNA-binding beta-propeller fold protein YncE